MSSGSAGKRHLQQATVEIITEPSSMIKINDTPPITPIRRAAKKFNAHTDDGTTPFSDIMEMLDNVASMNEIATEQAVQTLAPIYGLDALLSAQEADSQAQTQQQQLRRAHLALDSLEDLRHALLLGAIPSYLLNTIETRLNDLKQHVQDQDLRDIIEDIEIRAAVELAKLRMQR